MHKRTRPASRPRRARITRAAPLRSAPRAAAGAWLWARPPPLRRRDAAARKPSLCSYYRPGAAAKTDLGAGALQITRSRRFAPPPPTFVTLQGLDRCFAGRPPRTPRRPFWWCRPLGSSSRGPVSQLQSLVAGLSCERMPPRLPRPALVVCLIRMVLGAPLYAASIVRKPALPPVWRAALQRKPCGDHGVPALRAAPVAPFAGCATQGGRSWAGPSPLGLSLL
ncbi:hypothetical protein HPB50_004455 [Hyalomma asiaticum]|uniref:Uncharacterized protein n=1 Tax=Hyalomma asiaticum TaxID=266040 RepID=A0ACB7TCK1_HYAAI|nr:hypothetical protein HPB50_004455 [Hyalomma asiaticum]